MLIRKAEEGRLHPIGQQDHQDRCPSIEVRHHPKLLGHHHLDVDEGQQPVEEATKHAT